jgi:hypothetical protein
MTVVEAMNLIEDAHQRGELAPGTHLQRAPHPDPETGRRGWELSQGFSRRCFPTIQDVARALGLTTTKES